MAELPTTFGKYFLTEKLATGGMAEIYLAKLVGPGGFEKSLVIKQIHPRLTGQRQFVDLFVAEAKTLVALAHGNIVPVYELGVVEDTYFIAMEYIDGPTLYRLTEALGRRDQPMEPAIAAWIASRILEGLDYAHRKGEGVIHRDLSPRNVMLSRDGEVKIVDFGIAVADGAGGEPDATGGAPAGSFPYMSPEQVERDPLTGQSDLFSAGVLLWEMLVGRRLFARPTAEATLAAVTSATIPRPSSERSEVPERLDDVVMRALARNPGDRWATAGDMVAQLQRYLYALDTTPGPREVAALVARYCPPETRRLPTHSDLPSSEPGDPQAAEAAEAAETASDDATHVVPSAAAPSTAVIPRTAPPAGPSTAVVPRAAIARGKARARTETFATHVELAQIFAPAVDVPAAAEADPGRHEVPAARLVDPDDVPLSQPPPPTIRLPNVGEMMRGAPSRGLLVFAAVGTSALAIWAIVMVMQGKEEFLAAFDGGDDALGVTMVEDAVTDTATDTALDDGLPLDADPDAIVGRAGALDAMRAPSDAAPRDRADAAAPPDATEQVRLDAPAHPGATGTATLKIGADPWGEILVDHVARGRTPAKLTVAAGKHTIEVVFRGEDPPRTKTFIVDLDDGATRALQADFTGPAGP